MSKCVRCDQEMRHTAPDGKPITCLSCNIELLQAVPKRDNFMFIACEHKH